MMKILTRYFLSILLLLGVAVQNVLAVPISIANPSFEDTVLGEGVFTINGVGLSSWTVSASGSVGLWNPVTGNSGSFDVIPDGENVAYSHGPEISQTLSTFLTANTRYTLTVSVGDSEEEDFGGYIIQLLAGGVLLAEKSNSPVPREMEFITSTIVFDSPVVVVPGQSIEIVLDSLGSETSFDLVQLDASPLNGGSVPEPAALLLMGLGLAGLGFARRRIADIRITGESDGTPS